MILSGCYGRRVTVRPSRRDLYGEDFSALCADLVEATGSFAPDLVVGIETGGARVAEAMLAGLGRPAYVAVRLQRPATKAKSQLRLGGVIRRLPRPVADVLRWVEVEARELSLRRRTVDVDRMATGIEGLPRLRSAAAGARRVLVVDDTIDSGVTLSVVRRAAERSAPGADVRTAVLASTWRRPPVRPDYCLLDRTLLRLPSSLDAA